MKKPSKLNSPVLVGVVKERTASSASCEIANCLYGGAELIDLHLSFLDATDYEELKKIFASSPIPVLALNYNVKRDGTDASYGEDERAELFLRAVKAGAAGIDMQGYTFCPESKNSYVGNETYSFTKGNPKEVVTDEKIIQKQCAFIEKIHSLGGEVLLSCHPAIPMNAETVTELALYLEKRNPDIIKIVTAAENEDHLAESIRAMQLLKKELKTPVAYHASGNAGKLSRIINPMLGGHMLFCSNGYKEGSILEQPDLKTTKSVIEGLRKMI